MYVRAHVRTYVRIYICTYARTYCRDWRLWVPAEVTLGKKNSVWLSGTFLVFQAGHSLRSKHDIPCVPSARRSLCSKQDTPCVPSRAFIMFQAGHSLCSKQDICCVPILNGRKIARIARISTILGRNRSHRSDLIVRKFSRHPTIFRANEKT